MTRLDRLREFLVLVLIVLGAGLGLALGLMRRSPPPPSLDSIPAFLAAHDFKSAERIISRYLAVRPDNVQANMLMAQVALARVDQKPTLALDHLARIRSTTPAVEAIVELNRGKAYSALGRHDLAEASWKRALRLDPAVPEAGWALLGLFYVQGRRSEAHDLALELQAREPDPRDRIQLLLELVRQDVQPIGAESTARTFEPIVRDNPGDARTVVAFARALVKLNRADEGLGLLRALVKRDPADREAWDALLTAVDEASRPAELEHDYASLPPELARLPRFASHKAALLAERGDWQGAAEAYQLALEFDPSADRVLYRMARALKNAGDDRRSDAQARLIYLRRLAREDLTALYDEANRGLTSKGELAPDLCLRLAEARDRMGRPDEAKRWRAVAAGKSR